MRLIPIEDLATFKVLTPKPPLPQCCPKVGTRGAAYLPPDQHRPRRYHRKVSVVQPGRAREIGRISHVVHPLQQPVLARQCDAKLSRVPQRTGRPRPTETGSDSSTPSRLRVRKSNSLVPHTPHDSQRVVKQQPKIMIHVHKERSKHVLTRNIACTPNLLMFSVAGLAVVNHMTPCLS